MTLIRLLFMYQIDTIKNLKTLVNIHEKVIGGSCIKNPVRQPLKFTILTDKYFGSVLSPFNNSYEKEDI